MNKINKLFIMSFVASLLFFSGGAFAVTPASASDGLELTTIKACTFQYGGDNCLGDLKATNTTGYVLDGTASLHISYQGTCSNDQSVDFDGVGIKPYFSPDGQSWLPFSGWQSGITTVSGFQIVQETSYPKIKMETVSNLCPGNYVFDLRLEGKTDTGSSYVAPSVTVGGGGGGGYNPPPVIVPTTDNGRVMATSGEGGVTTLPNPDGGQVKLTIPAGAVSDDTLFVITPVVMGALTLPSAEQGLFVVDGFAYRITATRDGQPVTTFSKPLIFTITYTDGQVAGFNLSSLNLYTFQNGAWHLVGSQVNSVNHTITSTINHLTLFALLGTKTGNNQPVPQVIPPAVKGASTVVAGGGAIASGTGGQGLNQPAGTAGEKLPATKEQPSTNPASGSTVAVKPAAKGFRGFLANVAVAWKNLNKTTFYSLLGLILALILMLIGLKIWRKHKKELKRN